MRSLEAFCAEVHRRHDEEKKRQEKQRKAFLMTCIPLVLVISLSFLYPGFMRAESKDAGMENFVGSTAFSDTYRIKALQGDAVIILEAESEGAKQITSLFFKDYLDVSDLADGADLKPEEEAAEDSSTTSSQKNDDLTFVLTDESGKNIRFILEKECLIRLDTGEERILSQEELNLLYGALEKGSKG